MVEVTVPVIVEVTLRVEAGAVMVDVELAVLVATPYMSTRRPHVTA